MVNVNRTGHRAACVEKGEDGLFLADEEYFYWGLSSEGKSTLNYYLGGGITPHSVYRDAHLEVATSRGWLLYQAVLALRPDGAVPTKLLGLYMGGIFRFGDDQAGHDR